MKPSGVIKEASDRLVDQEPGFEFTTWSKNQLLSGFNWALTIIADMKPEVFATPLTLPLPQGGMVQLAQCDTFLPPYRLLNRKGEFIRDLAQGSVRGSLRTRPLCSAAGGPFYFNKIGDGVFEIFPANDEETGYQVQGICAQAPQAQHMEEDIDLPLRLRGAVLELMLHYAHMYDTEAVPSRDRAAVHWNNAMQIINPNGGRRADK